MAEGAQKIVGFIAIKFKDGDIECLDKLSYSPQLVNQLLRRRRAVCLVLVEEAVAEGGCFPVEGDGIVAGLELIDSLEQHTGKAIDGVYHLAGFTHRQWRQGVVGAVKEGITVDE